MCIFTGEVERVAGTRIFARLEADWQYLAYDLEFESQLETAMLLPLPVALPSNPDSVTFISLEHVSSFFDDLETSFESDGGEMPRSATLGGDEPLKVVSVGSFEASFVPSPGDFGRLDPRFQLPADVWERMPGYQDYGFAVFKLKPGNHRVHPMALKFRTRDSSSLFFPTVHVHDRRFEPWARFSHALYAQGPLAMNRDWVMSFERLGMKLPGDTGGLIAPREFGYRRLLYGVCENRDTRLALAAAAPRA